MPPILRGGLKNYKEDFIKRKREWVEAQELKDQKLSLLKAIAQESGGELRNDNGWRQGDHGLIIDGDDFTIKQNGDFYKFSLNLDFGQSLKIIQFLKEQNIISATQDSTPVNEED